MKRLIFKLFFICLSRFRIIFYTLLSNKRSGGGVTFIQATQLVGRGEISFGGNVRIGYFPSPSFFSTYAYFDVRSAQASIRVRNGTQINNGFIAIAENSSIEIGQNCLIGTHVEVYDSDFHALSWVDRDRGIEPQCLPVQIGDKVFIGSNVKILKGVTIGNGAIITNGSIVMNDVPENAIAGGVPAKVIGFVVNEKN